MVSANGTGDGASAALPQADAPARWLCRRRCHRRAGPDETLCFSTSAFAGVRMLEEVVRDSQGSVASLPDSCPWLSACRHLDPLGLLVVSALHGFGRTGRGGPDAC